MGFYSNPYARSKEWSGVEGGGREVGGERRRGVLFCRQKPRWTPWLVWFDSFYSWPPHVITLAASLDQPLLFPSGWCF